MDLPKLTTCAVEEESFYNTKSVVLSSIISVMIVLFDLPQLTSFITGEYSFNKTKRITLKSMMIDK